MSNGTQGVTRDSQAVAIGIRKLSPLAKIPEYQTAGAAGADVYAFVAEALEILPGARVTIPTGLSLEIPEGFEAQIRSRSGNAVRFGLVVLNSPGTIDSDYRGELRIILANLGSEPVIVNPGDRIAQIIFAPVWRASFNELSILSSTQRGEGGFGSTGRS